jgi:hypothetical protein
MLLGLKKVLSQELSEHQKYFLFRKFNYGTYGKMSSAWMEDQNKHHMLVSMRVIQSVTHSVDEDFSKGDDNVQPFSASTGWFSLFTKRYNFHNIEVPGEAASTDTVAVIYYIG